MERFITFFDVVSWVFIVAYILFLGIVLLNNYFCAHDLQYALENNRKRMSSSVFLGMVIGVAWLIAS